MEFLSGQLNFKIDAWTTFRAQVPLVQPSGAAIPVTGYTFASNIRIAKTSTINQGVFTVNVLDAAGGLLELYLSATQTGALWTASAKLYQLPPASGYLFLYWDLLGTAPGPGDTTKLASGTLQLVATVSH